MSEPESTLLEAGFAELYTSQWWPMVRVATGLLGQLSAAEDVVQDAFAGLYRHQGALRDPASAAGYLRRSVVNGSRSALRRRATARRYLLAAQLTDVEPADADVVRNSERRVVLTALRTLPERQREVLTLGFVGEYSDAEIAEATGLTAGAVRSTRSRGLVALRRILEAGE